MNVDVNNGMAASPMFNTVMATTVATLAAHEGPLPAALRPNAAAIAPFPPMMWHSWGLFTHEDEVNEANMKEMGDALVASGLASAGYDTINVVRSNT